MSKTKLVVFNEHTLGYIIPEQPYRVHILHTSILRGSYYTDRSVIYVNDGTIRLASKQDFDNFRVCFNGFNNPELYEFTTEHVS